MTFEATFAWVHFLSIAMVFSFLVTEWVIYQPALTHGEARRVALVDLAYGIAAVFAAGTGFTRALAYGKGWDFYAGNPIFWTKIAIFLAVAFLSLPPTFHFLSWREGLKRGEAPRIDPVHYRRIRRLIAIELVLLPWIPLCAVLMARGVGIR